jgi:hypothetical protein
MARFAQYAMVASEEALSDAGWSPKTEDDLEATVQRPLHPLFITDIMLGRLHGLRYRKFRRCVRHYHCLRERSKRYFLRILYMS